MALPRLRAHLADGREIARVLRGALRHEVEVVRLESPPATAGQHLLEIDVPEGSPVVLLADPFGEPTSDGHPLRLRPVTREQMATLLHLVERLDDEPSKSIPPPDAGPLARASSVEEHDPDETLIETMTVEEPDEPTRTPAFGVIESLVPESIASRPASRAPFPNHALVGRVLAGRYRIDSVIGSGATAAVFRAWQLDLERPVAIKVLHDENRRQTQFVKRFKAEALAASKLEHPNVARVLDFGLDADGLPYIVMELLAGRSLEAILAAEGRLPTSIVAKVAVQVCSALAVAHDAGIIHRDIKPENLMLVPGTDGDGSPCDVVKVCDFGLAKVRDLDPEHADLTTNGMLIGSPAYMSPEQTRGEPLDARSDVYSLGVAMFEALTGQLPHDAPSVAELFLKKVVEPPRRPSAVVPGVDPSLDEIVTKALAGDRDQRHASARALHDEMNRILERIG